MEIKSLPPGSCWPSTLSASLDQSLRKRRVIEARQLALDTSKATQERYRAALVADIEDELFQRKLAGLSLALAFPPSSCSGSNYPQTVTALFFNPLTHTPHPSLAYLNNLKSAWEAERASRVSSLKALYARSLMMIGEAQKAAVLEVSGDLSAVAQGSPWGALATATVQRGIRAAAQCDAERFQAERAGDAALYRSEVARVAAMQGRERVAAATHTSQQGGSRRGSSSSSSSSSGSRRGSSMGTTAAAIHTATHPLVPDGTPPSGSIPPRLSPFYGPHALAGVTAAKDVSTGRSVVGGLPRLPSFGPLNVTTSLVRAPYMAERGVEGGEDRGVAAANAVAAREALEESWRAARVGAAAAEVAAARRGSAAGQMIREPKEALLALEVMEGLAKERRGSEGGWSGGLMPCARSRASSVGSFSGRGGKVGSGGVAGGESGGRGGGPKGGEGEGEGEEEARDGEEVQEEEEDDGVDETELERAFLEAIRE